MGAPTPKLELPDRLLVDVGVKLLWNTGPWLLVLGLSGASIVMGGDVDIMTRSSAGEGEEWAGGSGYCCCAGAGGWWFVLASLLGNKKLMNEVAHEGEVGASFELDSLATLLLTLLLLLLVVSVARGILGAAHDVSGGDHDRTPTRGEVAGGRAGWWVASGVSVLRCSVDGRRGWFPSQLLSLSGGG